VPVLAADAGLAASPLNGLGMDTLVGGWLSGQDQFGTSTAWGTANRAIYVPVRVPRPQTVRSLGYLSNTTGTGNCDIGLYAPNGTRLVSTGSV